MARWLAFIFITVALADEAADDDSTREDGTHSHSHAPVPTPAPLQAVPKPVGASYPHISSVSGFLAAKYERDNLANASLAVTNFVMVAALAQKTTADIVSRQEARMPFGGFTLPLERTTKQRGRLYILCGLIEISWVSKAVRKVNPWPEWRLLCGKVFRASQGGANYLVRTVSPQRKSVGASDPRAQAVVQAAVDGLAQLPEYQRAGTLHKLVAVLSVQHQSVREAEFRRLALEKIPGDIDLFFVSFLTADDAFGTAPPVPHIAAVMRSAKTGIKIIRQISLGEPGFTVLRSAVGIASLSVFEFDAKAQDAFRHAVAQAVAHGTAPTDVQITSVDVLPRGAAVDTADLGLATGK